MVGKNWRKRKPKILSPIASFEGAVAVIDAGADEIYCGVELPGKLKYFTLYRGPGKSISQISTYEELSRIIKYAHERSVKVVLVVNEPFMTEAFEDEMRNHIRSCLDIGVDALMIGDIGVLSLVKDLGVDVPLFASTYFVSMNCEAVEFLRKLGFSRVILERHLSIEEISEIVSHSKVGIEVFCHSSGCSNINASCYLYHGTVMNPMMLKVMKVEAAKGLYLYQHTRKVIHLLPRNPCCFFYEVLDANSGRKICDAPILDAFTWCSLCHLSNLIQAGVTGLKIVGRGSSVYEQAASTKAYRELLDMIWDGRGRVRPENLKIKIVSLRKKLEKGKDEKMRDLFYPYQELYCKQMRCIFSPFFNVPYKSVIKEVPR